MVPAVGALLALAAALAAACFVKAFGITFLGRPRSAGGARPRTRSTAARSRRCSSWPRCACWPASCRAWSSTRWRRSRSELRRRPHAGAGRRAVAVDRADRREPQLLQRPAGLRVHRDLGARWRPSSSIASPRTRCGAARPGTAAFPMPTPADAIYAGSFAQPIRRVFGTLVFRAREHVDMPPPGRYAAGAAHGRDCTIWSGSGSIAPIAGAVGCAADRLNRLQFLTIRRYLSLVFAALVIAAAGARDMAVISRPPRAGRADAAGAAARAAADRLRAQGQGAAAAPAAGRRCSSPIAICCGCCARKWCSPTTPPGCSASRPI